MPSEIAAPPMMARKTTSAMTPLMSQIFSDRWMCTPLPTRLEQEEHQEPPGDEKDAESEDKSDG